MIVTAADFDLGKFELHTGMYDQPRIQEYIDRYEERYLVELLGADLYGEFKADLILGGGYPTEQRFIDIYEPFNIDYNLDIFISRGIKDMLIGFIYYEYAKDLINQMTPVGNVVPKGENSDNPKTLYTMFYTRYNEGCKSYKSIQNFICTKGQDYTGYNGRVKSFVYWI